MFLFDLDGTLLACEILPMLAAELGLGPEMLSLTRSTMNGEVPFDDSFRRRVDMLRGLPIAEAVGFVIKAPVLHELLDWIRARPSQCYVMTSNLDCWVRPWLEHYGLRGFMSEAEITDEGPRVARILRKDLVVASFAGRSTVVVGDGANDASAMRMASVGIGSGIVNPLPAVVIDVADYVVLEEVTLCRLMSRL